MPSKQQRADEWLTLREIAAEYKLHYLTVTNLRAAGEFPNAINVGGEGTRSRYRVPRKDVDAWRDSLRVVA